MSHRTDIDKQLAELEALIGNQPEEVAEVHDPEEGHSKFPGWLTIIGAAVAIDLAARFFIPSSDSFVRILEAVVFVVAGIALMVPIVRKKDLTALRRKIHVWLSAALGLGAIRSGMWGFGIPVEYANLTIFVIGIVGLAALYFVRRRAKLGR
jgi:hypothetical protein